MAKKRLKILLFADTHLGFDFPLHPRLKIRRRGCDFFTNFYKILTYAKDCQPDFLVHGGDLFFRSRVAAMIVDRVYKALFDFVNKTGIPIYIVPGNHERSCLPQSIYLAHPLIHVFNRPRCFFFEKDGIGVCLHGFPFFRGAIRDQFKELLQQCSWNGIKSHVQLLVMHQAIDGAQVGPSDYTFKNSKDVVDIRNIPCDTTAVLMGHIHRHQVLYANKIPLIYPGSIERTSFAEKDEQKGFYEIDFLQGSDHSKQWSVKKLKFIHLPARPMADIYLNRHYSKDEITRSIRRQIASLPGDCIVRLRMQDSDHKNNHLINLSYIRSLLPSSFSMQTGMEFRNNY